MAWKTERPTTEGVYWLRSHGYPQPAIVLVHPEFRGFRFEYYYLGDETPRLASDVSEGTEWAGPIEPPQ